MDVSRFTAGRVHVRISGLKGLNHQILKYALPLCGSVLVTDGVFVGVVDPPLFFPVKFLGFRFRVWIPSFFMANGRFT